MKNTEGSAFAAGGEQPPTSGIKTREIKKEIFLFILFGI